MPSRWDGPLPGPTPAAGDAGDFPSGPIPPGPPHPPAAGGGLVRPPLAWLVLAALCVVGCVVLLVPGTTASDVAGYLAGAVGASVLVTTYRWFDQSKREDPRYSPLPVLDTAAVAVLVLGYLVAIPHLWRLATELAK